MVKVLEGLFSGPAEVHFLLHSRNANQSEFKSEIPLFLANRLVERRGTVRISTFVIYEDIYEI